MSDANFSGGLDDGADSFMVHWSQVPNGDSDFQDYPIHQYQEARDAYEKGVKEHPNRDWSFRLYSDWKPCPHEEGWFVDPNEEWLASFEEGKHYGERDLDSRLKEILIDRGFVI